VFGGASQTRCITHADTVLVGQLCRLIQPHWKIAVIAATILAFECGVRVFGNCTGHDRLLEKSQDVRSLHFEVEAVTSRDLDLALTKPLLIWIRLQQSLLQALLN
jgi:hypothetical protein